MIMEKYIMNELLTRITEYVNNSIMQQLPFEESPKSKLISAMNYAMKSGGKRIRPTLMLLSYLCFYNDETLGIIEDEEQLKRLLELSRSGEIELSDIRSFMAAIEMIHTHSLIHDDLPALDNDTMRRGMPTVHVEFGEATAILAGDALLNYAYEIVSSHIEIAKDLYLGNQRDAGAGTVVCRVLWIAGGRYFVETLPGGSARVFFK